MSSNNAPKLITTINLWGMVEYPAVDREWSLDKKLEVIKGNGFDAITWKAHEHDDMAELCKKHGIRFAGMFDVAKQEDMAGRIQAQLDVDADAPINVQLCDDDTEVDHAIEMTIALMEEAENLNADVYLEMHRDTCTETPEKMYAIIDGYEKQTGKELKVNFDFSHPAIVKHLTPQAFSERLILRPDKLKKSRLLHIRPFNGHHCQIPISKAAGGFSDEFEDFRPFAYDLFRTWLSAENPGDELWVVPELGPVCSGYGLSIFPDIVEDTFLLGRELEKIWADVLSEVGKENINKELV